VDAVRGFVGTLDVDALRACDANGNQTICILRHPPYVFMDNRLPEVSAKE
jgi:hypothetical protein